MHGSFFFFFFLRILFVFDVSVIRFAEFVVIHFVTLPHIYFISNTAYFLSLSLSTHTQHITHIDFKHTVLLLSFIFIFIFILNPSISCKHSLLLLTCMHTHLLHTFQPTLSSDLDDEITAILHSLIYASSVCVFSATYGHRLLNLVYKVVSCKLIFFFFKKGNSS